MFTATFFKQKKNPRASLCTGRGLTAAFFFCPQGKRTEAEKEKKKIRRS